MNPNIASEHVLPRPVERLPDFANSKARQNCAERVTEAFSLRREAALAIANAVVDPTSVRRGIGDPAEPNVEEIPVPGGVLFGIRTTVWSRKVIPDPRNPRTGPARNHPFALDPGMGSFRPVPEPRAYDEDPTLAQLRVSIDNPDHLAWALVESAKFIAEANDWTDSIRSQGVMEYVWLVPITYEHAEGQEPVCVLTSVEGSSRMTAVHRLLNVRSAEIPYDDNDAKLRANSRKLNESLAAGPDAEQSTMLRNERVPALIVVGFRPHASSATTFPTAIKSLVALRHVDPPKPWGPGPENESLADEVLDELYRRSLITALKRDYLAGTLTRDEARTAGFPADPVLRAAEIVRLFSSQDEQTRGAVRVAITSQSTRKRITGSLADELSTALILRGVVDERAKTDRTRRYLKEAFGGAVHRETWRATGRSYQELANAALLEVRRWIGDGQRSIDPGPSSLELAVRAAYALVLTGRLNADQGTQRSQQPDRRRPGEVVDAMRRTIHGVMQLAQALEDFSAEEPIRAVDQDGRILARPDGTGDVHVNDVLLRREFPPYGKTKAPPPGDTPSEVLARRVHDLGQAFEQLSKSFELVRQVQDYDGEAMVEKEGINTSLCDSWRKALAPIEEELLFWGRSYSKFHGRPSASTQVIQEDANDFPESEEEEDEVYA